MFVSTNDVAIALIEFFGCGGFALIGTAALVAMSFFCFRQWVVGPAFFLYGHWDIVLVEMVVLGETEAVVGERLFNVGEVWNGYVDGKVW